MRDVLWQPSPESTRGTRIAAFAAEVAQRRGLSFGDPVGYDALWRWSVDHLDQFWGDLARWTGVADVPDDRVLPRRAMPGAEWFPGTTVNYAEQVFRQSTTDHPAVIATAEDTDPVELSWAELRGQVGAFAATLRRLGVRPGDRVAGYLPNVPEAVVAFLGAAAVGAVWSACAPAARPTPERPCSAPPGRAPACAHDAPSRASTSRVPGDEGKVQARSSAY